MAVHVNVCTTKKHNVYSLYLPMYFTSIKHHTQHSNYKRSDMPVLKVHNMYKTHSSNPSPAVLSKKKKEKALEEKIMSDNLNCLVRSRSVSLAGMGSPPFTRLLLILVLVNPSSLGKKALHQKNDQWGNPKVAEKSNPHMQLLAPPRSCHLTVVSVHPGG